MANKRYPDHFSAIDLEMVCNELGDGLGSEGPCIRTPPLRTFKNHDIFNKAIQKYTAVEYCQY